MCLLRTAVCRLDGIAARTSPLFEGRNHAEGASGGCTDERTGKGEIKADTVIHVQFEGRACGSDVHISSDADGEFPGFDAGAVREWRILRMQQQSAEEQISITDTLSRKSGEVSSFLNEISNGLFRMDTEEREQRENQEVMR